MFQRQHDALMEDSDMAASGGQFVPGPDAPLRASQIVRHRKIARPGVPETISELPKRFVVPLLLAKAHAEIHEASTSSGDAAEFADSADVLAALAIACSHSPADIEQLASDLPGSIYLERDRGTPPSLLVPALAGRLHGLVEDLARDLGNIRKHAAALECLWSMAEAAEVSWESVEAEGEVKREEFGDFGKAMFWESVPPAGAVAGSVGYVPEMGQAAFGQRWQQFEVPEVMTATLAAIRDEYSRVYFNATQKECPSPFGNNGTSLVTPVFTVHAYSWSEEEQPFNFSWGDLRLSWYKRCGRGMSANMEITPEMAARCLEECLACIRAMESGHDEDFSRFIDLS